MRHPAARSVTQDEVRRRNLASLLRLVHGRGRTSRSDLAGLLGLNRSTIKALCAELVAAGLLVESPPVGTGSAGRPSITIGPESESFYVLALQIGVEHLTAVRMGLGGVQLDTVAEHLAPGGSSVTSIVGRLVQLVRQLTHAAPAGAVCLGTGIAVAGTVNSVDGMVRFAPNLGWVDVPLREIIATAVDAPWPVHVGNDANLGALAEHMRGVGVGLDDFIYLSGEVGIGGGIFMGGRPLSGSAGLGGEVGHMVIDPRGRVCRCGRRGCWETEIGVDAVLQSTGARPGASLDDVLRAYRAGATWPREGLQRVGQMLGAGLVNLVNLFNPAAIVFGGVTGPVFDATRGTVERTLQKALPASRTGVRLLRPRLGEGAITAGAAELAFAPLFDDPLGPLLWVANGTDRGCRPTLAFSARQDARDGTAP